MGKKYFWGGKFFETIEEMKDFIDKWPSMQIDLDQYRHFLDERWKEAKCNLESRGTLTNIEAYYLLRMNTDWVPEVLKKQN